VSPFISWRDFFLYSLRHPKVRRAAYAAAALGVLDLLVLGILWAPVALRHHGLADSLEKRRQAEAQTQKALDEAGRCRELEKRVGFLEAKWRTPATQSDLVDSITGLARRQGLRVLAQDFSAADEGKDKGVFRQTLTLAGSYASLRRFLSGLEDLPTLTVAQQARLEQGAGPGGSLRATLQITTFTRGGAEAHG